MEFRILGPLEVVDQGRPVTLGGPKERVLLAILLLHANDVVPTDRLIEEIWAGEPPPSAVGTLQAHVSRLRRRLGENEAASSRVTSRGGGYVLAVEEGELEATRFEHLAHEGRAALDEGDVETARRLLGQALDLWRGRPLADVTVTPATSGLVGRLEEARLSALEDRIEADLALGRPTELCGELEALVAEYPLRERLSAQLMTALYRSGRQAEAIAVYDRLRDALVEELGIDPSPAVQDLHVAILQQRPELRPDSLMGSVDAPSNLPEPRNSFVGREDDLARIADLLAERRLVTLTGVGGVGKTRLAVAVAQRLRERFPGGTYFVDLSSARDSVSVLGRVAAVLGLFRVRGFGDAGDIGATEDIVAEFLRNRQVLVVLDNCEHLVETCAVLVDRILSEPGPTVLATSREVLGVDGEQWWPVVSLRLPEPSVDEGVAEAEAMRLLIDRMRAVRPEYEPKPEHQDALVDICVRLDGIPLALELAAARVAHLNPREIADRLDDRFALLGVGRNPAVPRHQTLEAALDWSYELLDPDEQLVLRRLAVFSGTFDLDAVSEVCVDRTERPALDLVGSLVEKSLVVSESLTGTVTRYRLLETVRAYAEAKLVEAGEVEATRSRHRDHFLSRLEAEPWDRCLLSESFARQISPDESNLRSAFAWCHTQDRADLLRRFLLRIPVGFQNSEEFAARSHWFELVLDHEKARPRRERLFHLVAQVISNNLHWTGDLAVGEAALGEIDVVLADLQDHDPVKAYAYYARAYRLSLFGEARAVEMERACDLAVEHAGRSVPLLRLCALAVKSIALLYQRRHRDAAVLLEDVHRSDEWDADVEIPWIRLPLSVAHYLETRPGKTLELLTTDLSLSDTWVRTARVIRAVALASLDDLEQARETLSETIAWVRESAWTHPLAAEDCLAGCAVLAHIEGDPERASRLMAALPGMATSVPWPYLLLRHHRDRLRDQLDRTTRRRCVEDGRAITVDDAIDAELTRWDAEDMASRPAGTGS